MPANAAFLDLLARFRQGDRLALARLLSLASRGEKTGEIETALPARAQPARVVAFTGGAGVGKSTLVGKLIDVARQHGRRLAVLACDPESPLTGGALLGDRFRMGSRDDDGVFIRSLAAPGGQGAIAEHLPLLVHIVESFGFDLVFLETVGAGQGDTAVRALADVVVLLLQAETGDDIQWEKAGVLEVADVIVVHKADLPGSEQAAAQVRAALDLGPAAHARVLLVSSKTGQGLEQLWAALESYPRRRGVNRPADELLHIAQEELGHCFHELERNGDPTLARLVKAWHDGTLSGAAAARELFRACLGHIQSTELD